MLKKVNTGSLSKEGTMRDAFRMDIQVEQKSSNPQLKAALRHALRSPMKKYKPGHFSALGLERELTNSA